MIFRVTMKDPDTLYDAIDEQLDEELPSDNEEAEAVREIRRSRYAEIASKWFEYGEYLTVEIDTDNKTIHVVPAGEE